MSPNNIHFLSYNTHLFLETAVEVKESEKYYDSTRLNNIITLLKHTNPDIIGFSEVWANSSKDIFIDALKSQLPYSAWDQNTNPVQLGSGLLLLSRFPLSNVSFIPYANLIGWDRLSQKGFIIANVKVSSQKLLIVHTHTQAGENSDAIKTRTANLNQLLNILNTVIEFDSIPVVMLGDLNIIGENELGSCTQEYKILCNQLKWYSMIDSYRRLNPSATSEPGYTYDAVNNKLIDRFDPSFKNKRQRLDYMFVRGVTPVSVTVPKTFTFQTSDGTMDLSDHYPLEGHFLLTE